MELGAVQKSLNDTIEIASMEDKEGGAILYGDTFFSDVPEGCIASIISFTTPLDASRLALVSRDFLSASEFDVVWQRFLPSDCDLIVTRSDGGDALLDKFRNKKKQLYMHLADRPLLVDGASKNIKQSFWLEKSSGRKCWMVSAKSLSIAWVDVPAYWKWTSIPESSFPQVAELLKVCWLDVRGRIPNSMLSPSTQYVAYLVFNTKEDAYGLENAFEASVSTARGEITRTVYLGEDYVQFQGRRGGIGQRLKPQPEAMADQIPKPRTDGWKEVKIGEFFTYPGEEDDEVELSVREVKVLNGKRGLIVEGIEFRPA